jgi:hypothetical protein
MQLVWEDVSRPFPGVFLLSCFNLRIVVTYKRHNSL